MKENIYEYFNCNTNEELFEMLINESEQVQELTDFYDTMNQSIRTNSFKFEGAHSGIEFINEKEVAPQKGTVTVAALSTKLEVNSWSNFSTDIPRVEAIKSFFSEDTKALIFFANDDDIDFTLDLKEYFESCGIDILDMFVINPNNKEQLFSYAESRSNYYESFENVFDRMIPYRINESSYLDNIDSIIKHDEKHIVPTDKLDLDIINEIHSLQGLDVFSSYYIENVILDKHILVDEDEVIKAFKVGLQDLTQENLYMITYDENRIINGVEKLSIGALSSTIVPQQPIISRYLDDDVHGAVFVHNHPSGNTDPSQADINTSIHLMDVAEGLDKEFIEHYVVGYSGHSKVSHHDQRLHEVKLKVYDQTMDNQLSLNLTDRLNVLEQNTPKFKGHEVKEKER